MGILLGNNQKMCLFYFISCLEKTSLFVPDSLFSHQIFCANRSIDLVPWEYSLQIADQHLTTAEVLTLDHLLI